MELIYYNDSLKAEWDLFVESSKNGTFLFKRDYMEYHSDRFEDNSLLFYQGKRLRAVFPAAKISDSLISHPGLTYGGMVTDRKMTVTDMLEIFRLLTEEAKRKGFNNIYYKPVPYIYDSLPAQEDLYALFRHGATIESRNVSSVVETANRLKFREIRKQGVRKAVKIGYSVSPSDDYEKFWDILSQNLKTRYDSSPVHSLAEISLLAQRFSDNIKLFATMKGDEMTGGTVCYITERCVHVQYISASAEGKENGALDLLFSYLLNDVFPEVPYFDFGTSNENGGRYLNESLIYQKEGFGGRAVCYDNYRIEL